MKSWNELEFSPHEGGTTYVPDLVEVLDSSRSLRQYIEVSIKRYPGRWILVYSGYNTDLGRKKYDGAHVYVTRVNGLQTVGKVSYSRTHVRIYAHDGSNITPQEMAEQAKLLPKPSFDVELNEWVSRLKLPHIDMTDNGFNWTQEELQNASNLAMTALHRGVPLDKIIRLEVSQKAKAKRNAVERTEHRT